MEEQTWEIPEGFDYQKLDKDYLKLCLDLAEKELKGALEVSTNVTNRGYQALIAIVPGATIAASTLLKMVFDEKLDLKLFVACCLILYHLIYAFNCLFEVIFPRDMYNIGNAPRRFFKEEHFGIDKEDGELKRLIAINLEDYQYRIDFMHSQNAIRVHKVETAFMQVKQAFIKLALYLGLLIVIWAWKAMMS